MKTARKSQTRLSGPAATRRKRQHVYLDDDDLRSLRITANELGISRSHAIQLAIRAFCIAHHGRKVDS